jgi:hypothetical protein
MKKEYEKPEIQCYKMDIDSIMNELSVPKNPGDSTDEQCSKSLILKINLKMMRISQSYIMLQIQPCSYLIF